MIESELTMRDEALVQTRDLSFGTEQTGAPR